MPAHSSAPGASTTPAPVTRAARPRIAPARNPDDGPNSAAPPQAQAAAAIMAPSAAGMRKAQIWRASGSLVAATAAACSQCTARGLVSRSSSSTAAAAKS